MNAVNCGYKEEIRTTSNVRHDPTNIYVERNYILSIDCHSLKGSYIPTDLQAVVKLM